MVQLPDNVRVGVHVILSAVLLCWQDSCHSQVITSRLEFQPSLHSPSLIGVILTSLFGMFPCQGLRLATPAGILSPQLFTHSYSHFPQISAVKWFFQSLSWSLHYYCSPPSSQHSQCHYRAFITFSELIFYVFPASSMRSRAFCRF